MLIINRIYSAVQVPPPTLQFQGDEKLDTDIPTSLEARLFCTTFGKLIWMSLQPLFYALRPVITYPKTPTLLEIVNNIIQLTCNFLVFYYFGGLYFVLSCLLSFFTLRSNVLWCFGISCVGLLFYLFFYAYLFCLRWC